MRVLLFLFLCSCVSAQDRIALYENGPGDCATDAPTETTVDGAIGLRNERVGEPWMSYYAPVARSARSRAVVIAPGGGYWIQAWDLEGTDIARYLAARGYHAFVLAYRLPGKTELPCKTHVALDDAQQAIRRVRVMADSLGVDSIGIMGFSAGGHLAGSASVHHTERDGMSSRPDFSVLVYPVTLMGSDSSAHSGSQRSLLGEDPDPDLLQYYNLPMQVDSLTPPTLLVHASDDAGVPPANALRYYEALLRHGVPADLRIYATGGHGFGAARERAAPVNGWLEEVVKFIETH